MTKLVRSEVSRGDEPAYFYELLRLANILVKKCDAVLGDNLGLSFSSAQALMFLSSYESSTQADIATALGVTPAVITRHITSFMQRKLASGVQNQANRRQNTIQITAKGRELAERAEKLIQAVAKPVGNALDDTARHILERSLAKILEKTK